MKTLSLALVVASAVGAVACSSKSSSGDDDGGGGIDAPTGPVEACSDTVEHYCSQADCPATPAEARTDSMLCPSNEVSCADATIVYSTMPDSGVNLYYQNGVLVGVETVTIAGTRCVAGPDMFAPPNCGNDPGTSIPICAHSAR